MTNPPAIRNPSTWMPGFNWKPSTGPLRSTMRLEPEFRAMLTEIAQRECCTENDVIRRAVEGKAGGNDTSAVRVAIAMYWRNASADQSGEQAPISSGMAADQPMD